MLYSIDLLSWAPPGHSLLHHLVIPCCRYGLPQELPFLRLHLLGERYHPALGSDPDLQPSNPRSVLTSPDLVLRGKGNKNGSAFLLRR